MQRVPLGRDHEGSIFCGAGSWRVCHDPWKRYALGREDTMDLYTCNLGWTKDTLIGTTKRPDGNGCHLGAGRSLVSQGSARSGRQWSFHGSLGIARSLLGSSIWRWLLCTAAS